jgi:membrane protein DedA with SNARE-associated domain
MNAITEFLIANGALILFLVGFVEQSGLPIPCAPWLLAAGALAANGRFSLVAAICWTAIGSLAADVAWFYLGQRGKGRVFRLFPHLHALQSKLNLKTQAGMMLHGFRMLTIAKFLPFGTVIPLHAGAMELGLWRFLVVDVFSSLFYAAAYVFTGFYFHKQLEQVVAFLQKLGSISLWIILILAGAYVAHEFIKRRRSKTSAIVQTRGQQEEKNVLLAPAVPAHSFSYELTTPVTEADFASVQKRLRTGNFTECHQIIGCQAMFDPPTKSLRAKEDFKTSPNKPKSHGTSHLNRTSHQKREMFVMLSVLLLSFASLILLVLIILAKCRGG